MDPQAVATLCHAHADAEAEFDIDGVLATLVPSPRHEFFPLALSLTGWATIERFDRHQYPRFVAQVVGYELSGEWVNEQAALQEYVINLRGKDDGVASYRVMSIMSVDDAVGRLSGERLYCDEWFVRALLGPLFTLLEGVGGG